VQMRSGIALSSAMFIFNLMQVTLYHFP